MAPSLSHEDPSPQAAASSSFPAALLWGHQLKRQHELLYDRMCKLEAEHQGYDARIRSAEVAAETVKRTAQDVKKLKRTLSAIDETDRHRSAWIESTEPRLAKLQEDAEKGRKVQPRVSALEGRCDDLDSELQRSTTSHRHVLDKIAALERQVQTDFNDMGQLSQRLQSLEALRTQETKTAKAMQDRINTLEQALKSTDSKNEHLRTRPEAALFTRDHPLPTRELSTERLQPFDPVYVQVPASPQYDLRGRRSQAALREESPALNAQLRRSVRMTRGPAPAKRQSPQNAQAASIYQASPSETPDLDAPFRPVDTQHPNCSKKRKAAPEYQPRQTRSQASKLKAIGYRESTSPVPSEVVVPEPKTKNPSSSKVVVLKPGSRKELSNGRLAPSQSSRPGDSTRFPQHPTHVNQNAADKPNGTDRSAPPAPPRVKRRRRREIEQPEDLETFLAACPFA